MEPTDIQKVETAPLATHTSAVNVMDILRKAATDPNCDVDKLEKLLNLHERVSDRAAAQEFAVAHVAFQRDCPVIPKKQLGKMTKGASTLYTWEYASIADIRAATRQPLLDNGLSVRFGDSVIDNGYITETCTLAHVNGHSITASSTVPLESAAGSSAQQKCGSASSFAQRYAITKVLGVVTSDIDEVGDPGPVITVDQHNIIGNLIKETNADTIGFLNHFKIEELKDLRQSQFAAAERMLCDKLAHQKKGQSDGS